MKINKYQTGNFLGPVEPNVDTINSHNDYQLFYQFP